MKYFDYRIIFFIFFMREGINSFETPLKVTEKLSTLCVERTKSLSEKVLWKQQKLKSSHHEENNNKSRRHALSKLMEALYFY